MMRRFGAFALTAMFAIGACQGGPTGGGASPTAAGTSPAASPAGAESPTTSPAASPAASPAGTSPAATGGGNVVTIAAGEPIRLGTALVITGANEALGLDSQYGAEVGRKLRPEVLGHQVEFNHQDDGCSAEGGQTAARALVSDPQIVAIIGTSCSSAGIPAAEITSGAGVILISPSNTAPSLTDPATHQPYYLRTAHNDKVQGEAMARFACEELQAKTAATIHDGSPYAQQLQQVFVDNFQRLCGGNVVAQEAINVGDTDFRPLLTSLAGQNPDFLYYPIFVAEGALVTTQAREILPNARLAGSDGIFTPDFLEAAGDAAEGMYLSGPDLEFSGEFYAQTFLPAYTEVSNEEEPISVFHAHAFDAYNMLLDAIEDVAEQGADGSLTIDRQALRDRMFQTRDFQGITGNLTCNETGDCADPAISVSIVENNDFKRIWPEGGAEGASPSPGEGEGASPSPTEGGESPTASP